MMEKAIGGYFELELPRHKEYHADAIKLNSGKNCLEYILRCRKYSKVYIPYYTCGVVLRPFQKLGITYQFYHINRQLEIADDIVLHEGEAVLYTNYYGLKSGYVTKLAVIYGTQLIVDNTQAFFARPIDGIDTFYTCRKFFGVPDGAYLYIQGELIEEIKQATSYEKVSHLIKRIDLSPEAGFEEYHHNEGKLENADIMQMSSFTERMMQSIDYDQVAELRRENYKTLQNILGSINQIDLPFDEDAVPMVYPYLIGRDDLRQHLIQNKIFVARYWPNVLEWVKKDSIEYELTSHMLPLPIDQRYGQKDMKSIIDMIKNN